MPKVLPQKIKSTAYQLYMQGTPITQIYEKLLEELPNEKFVRSTVYSWPKAFRWDEDKNEVRVKAKEQIIESEGQRIARLQKEHLDEYEQIREKAKVELAGLEFNSGEGAAKTLDMGIQGQRSYKVLRPLSIRISRKRVVLLFSRLRGWRVIHRLSICR